MFYKQISYIRFTHKRKNRIITQFTEIHKKSLHSAFRKYMFPWKWHIPLHWGTTCFEKKFNHTKLPYSTHWKPTRFEYTHWKTTITRNWSISTLMIFNTHIPLTLIYLIKPLKLRKMPDIRGMHKTRKSLFQERIHRTWNDTASIPFPQSMNYETWGWCYRSSGNMALQSFQS